MECYDCSLKTVIIFMLNARKKLMLHLLNKKRCLKVTKKLFAIGFKLMFVNDCEL